MIVAFLRPFKKGQRGFAKALLMVFAAFLMFGGPTYLLYILDSLKIPRVLGALVGMATFTAGAILFVYLSKKEGKVGPPS